jgi:hypothetical protein
VVESIPKQAYNARNSSLILATTSAGVLEQSMGATNRVGIELSYRPGRMHRLAESIPGLLEGLEMPSQVYGIL